MHKVGRSRTNVANPGVKITGKSVRVKVDDNAKEIIKPTNIVVGSRTKLKILEEKIKGPQRQLH